MKENIRDNGLGEKVVEVSFHQSIWVILCQVNIVPDSGC
jgi:hypothetical protein